MTSAKILSGSVTFGGGKNKLGLEPAPKRAGGLKPVSKINVQRLLDVNLNRAREALRVCEDIARFVLEDKFLTDSIKDVRHKVGEIADRLQEKVIKFRDIKSDFGKKNSFDKIKTKDFKTLFYKNIHRAQESIRALEEFSKILGEKIYGNFKMLRFKAYSIEKKAIEKLQAICSN